MKRIKTSEARRFPYHYPSNASIVTARDGDRRNCIAVSRHAWFAFNPPMYGVGIGSAKHTCELIRASRQFAINWLPFEAVTKIAAAGSASGRDVDKFDKFDIRTAEPLVIQAPIVEGAYAVYECEVVSEYSIGDSTWFAANIVAVHFDERVFTDTLQMKKLAPVLWLSREIYAKAENPRLYRVDRRALTVEEI